jgi:hypothetical protein
MPFSSGILKALSGKGVAFFMAVSDNGMTVYQYIPM